MFINSKYNIIEKITKKIEITFNYMSYVNEMQQKYLNLCLQECSSGYQGPNCS